MKTLNVINLYGGPGSGKSTTAAGLFYELKKQHFNVELVTEFAKDLVYADQLAGLLDQQEYIFGEQNFRLHRLRGKVDWAITDSPIMLATTYAQPDYPCIEEFRNLVLATDKTYTNINIFLKRPDTFSQDGRAHTLEEAKSVDDDLLDMLNQHNIPYDVFTTDDNVVESIINKYFRDKPGP